MTTTSTAKRRRKQARLVNGRKPQKFDRRVAAAAGKGSGKKKGR